MKKHRSRCLCGPHLKNIEYVPIEIPKIDVNTEDEPSEIPDYIKYLPDYVKYLPDYVKYLPDYVKYLPDYVKKLPDYVKYMDS